MPKQMVFLSHVHEDQYTANVLEEVIKKALLGGLEVFNSSNRKSISVGDPWRDVIVERLHSSRTLLVLATPESVSSPWVNFEAGGAWVAGNRVIPCCAKGMTPSSLPAPLSHLQAIDLSSSDDLRTLIKHLADVVDLDAPLQFNYQEAVETIVGSWQGSLEEPSNDKFLQWLKKVSARPRKFKGETCQGFVKISHISAVTPFDANQFYGEKISAGESIGLWLKPVGKNSETLFHCFANDPVASLLFEIGEEKIVQVTTKCLGQLKVFTLNTIWGDEERGVEYPLALLITDVKNK